MAVGMLSQLLGPSRIASSADLPAPRRVSPEAKAAAETLQGTHPYKWSMLGSWLVALAASGFTGFLLWRFRIAIDARDLALFSGMMAFLIIVHVVYGRWRTAPTLSHLGGAVAATCWSIVAAAVISLVGLRYKFPLIDDVLGNADRAVGVDLPSMIRWFADHPLLSHLLSVAYDSWLLQLAALLPFLAMMGRFDKLWQLVFVFSLTVVVAATFSVFWPARGAFAYFHHPIEVLEQLPDGAGIYHLAKFEYFRNALSPNVSFENLQGVVTFPSFHTCLVLMTICATTGTRWLLAVTLIWNALVLIATVPIGGHYVIDLSCGGLLWLAAMAIEAILGRSYATMRGMPVPEAASA